MKTFNARLIKVCSTCSNYDCRNIYHFIVTERLELYLYEDDTIFYQRNYLKTLFLKRGQFTLRKLIFNFKSIIWKFYQLLCNSLCLDLKFSFLTILQSKYLKTYCYSLYNKIDVQRNLENHIIFRFIKLMNKSITTRPKRSTTNLPLEENLSKIFFVHLFLFFPTVKYTQK